MKDLFKQKVWDTTLGVWLGITLLTITHAGITLPDFLVLLLWLLTQETKRRRRNATDDLTLA